MKINLIKRKKTILIILLLIIVVLGVALLIIKMLNSPAEGIIKQTKTYDAFTKNEDRQPGTYSDKYITFKYPATYSLNESQKSGNFLDVVKLYSNDHSSTQITIGIVKENLGDDSGINHRKGHPETYEQKSSSPNSIVFTSNKNGSEQTGYIQHGDKVISISITTPGQKDLSKDYQTIASSLEWK